VSLLNACFFFGHAIGAALIGLAANHIGYEPVFLTIAIALQTLCW